MQFDAKYIHELAAQMSLYPLPVGLKCNLTLNIYMKWQLRNGPPLPELQKLIITLQINGFDYQFCKPPESEFLGPRFIYQPFARRTINTSLARDEIY